MEEKLRLLQKLAPDVTEDIIKRYRVLKAVSLLQPCGRRMVVLNLGMTERTVRSEIERFSVQKLVNISKSGMTITKDGIEVLTGLEKIFSMLTGFYIMEEKLSKVLGVNRICIAARDLSNNEQSGKEMAQIAARRLLEIVDETDRIAIAGGETMYNLVNALPTMSGVSAKMVVPARGSIGRNIMLQADTIAAALAKKLQSEYRLLHIPDNLSQTALEEMKKQEEIAETIKEMEKANIILLGVGNAIEMAEKRKLDEETKKFLCDNKAVAESCGCYFDLDGRIIYKTRSIAIDFENISKRDEVIVVAGGSEKAASILALSKSIPNAVFVTDELAANEILNIIL